MEQFKQSQLTKVAELITQPESYKTEKIKNIRNKKILKRAVFKDESGPFNGIFEKKEGGLTTKYLIKDGLIIDEWWYPTIEKTFFSKMVNDENLAFTTGYPNEVDPFFQLVEGKKPMATSDYEIAERDEACEFIHSLLEEHELLPAIMKIPDKDIIIPPHKRFIGSTVFVGLHKGKFSEMFDMNALANDYLSYLKASFKYIDEVIQDTKFLDEITGWFMDYAPNQKMEEGLNRSLQYLAPMGAYDCIMFGLVMGYPIETTFSKFFLQSNR